MQDNRIEPQRYYELFEKDTIRFGNSRYEINGHADNTTLAHMFVFLIYVRLLLSIHLVVIGRRLMFMQIILLKHTNVYFRLSKYYQASILYFLFGLQYSLNILPDITAFHIEIL